MEEEVRRANDLNGQLSLLKRKELQRIQSQAGSIRVSMVYLTMVQEAQNVVTYTINLMKVSRKFKWKRKCRKSQTEMLQKSQTEMLR